MSWVVKTLRDGEYHGARRYWVKERSEAKRFVSREDAERFASNIDASYQPRVIRLVPKRKPEPDAGVVHWDRGSYELGLTYGFELENCAVARWLKRQPDPCGALHDAATRIRAGEHRR